MKATKELQRWRGKREEGRGREESNGGERAGDGRISRRAGGGAANVAGTAATVGWAGVRKVTCTWGM